jgi:hypothetical protein
LKIRLSRLAKPTKESFHLENQADLVNNDRMGFVRGNGVQACRSRRVEEWRCGGVGRRRKRQGTEAKTVP